MFENFGLGVCLLLFSIITDNAFLPEERRSELIKISYLMATFYNDIRNLGELENDGSHHQRQSRG